MVSIKYSFKFYFVVLLMLFSGMGSALAQTVPVKKLIDMETQANAAAARSNISVAMPHYEIPLRLLSEGKNVTADQKIYQSLVFEKNGEKYVRWVVNPEDTKWYKEVESFLVEKGISPERKTYFKGYQTASRSYIVVDPMSGAQFSIKSSTDRTGGAWRDKKQDYKDAYDILNISDLLDRTQQSEKFQNFVIMREPLFFGIKNIDQSIVVRELADLTRSQDRYYIPGFSVLHETVGKEIASLNGSNDPSSFWEKYYIEPLAKSAAEIVARTGVWFDSPHSQNFLIEFDRDMKPTGKIILRDLGDVYINKQIVEALGEGKILEKFSAKENILTYLSIGFGPLHGNTRPSWVHKALYDAWGEKFNEVFSREFYKRTKIQQAKYTPSSGYSYYDVAVDGQSKDFMIYQQSIRPVAKWCTKIF